MAIEFRETTGEILKKTKKNLKVRSIGSEFDLNLWIAIIIITMIKFSLVFFSRESIFFSIYKTIFKNLQETKRKISQRHRIVNSEGDWKSINLVAIFSFDWITTFYLYAIFDFWLLGVCLVVSMFAFDEIPFFPPFYIFYQI